MDERWGGGWELGKNGFEKGGFMYMMSPGGHRWRTAIIFANNFELKKNSYEMTDIYGVIMDVVKGEWYVTGGANRLDWYVASICGVRNCAGTYFEKRNGSLPVAR